jgi:hypothetical protein
MNPEDDPEARIRALEQPLSEMARASELGAEHRPGVGYPPPVQQWPYPPNPYPVGYPPAPPPRSGLRPWMLIIPIAVVLMAAGAGAAWVMYQNAATPDVSGGGGIITGVPPNPGSTVHKAPSVVPSEPLPQPGSTVSVAGIGAVKTIACNDNVVVVSGANNRITITGHCAGLTVSGFENNVTVDAADTITAAGFDNHIAFRSGTPGITKSGEGNVVEQG